MNYMRYEKLCALLKGCLDFYEQMHVKDYTFSYTIASGDNVSFRINEAKIPHLLGVNTNLIRSSNLSSTLNDMSSFELLNYMLCNSSRFSRYLINNHIDINMLFSPMIEEKIKSFETCIRYGLSSVLGTIKIDRSKNWQDGMPEAIDVDYLLIKEMKDDYAVLGLRKNADSYYVPVSNMCWSKSNLDKYMKYLKKQECSFPIKLFIKEINKKMWFNDEEKKFRLRLLKQWANRFDMSIVVSYDYEKMLLKNLDKMAEKENLNDLLEEMTVSIVKNNFPIDTNYDDFSLKKLSYAINNAHFKYSRKDELSSSKIKEELKLKKEQLIALQDENKKLKDLNAEKDEEIEKMRSELNIYKAIFSNVRQNIMTFEESQPETPGRK